MELTLSPMEPFQLELTPSPILILILIPSPILILILTLILILMEPIQLEPGPLLLVLEPERGMQPGLPLSTAHRRR